MFYDRRVLARIALLVLTLAAIGCHRIGSCEAQNVSGVEANCSGPEGWMWNGSACVFTHACNCTGDDCQGLYHDREHCETAHTHCVK
jgi:hypothetical protein